MWCEKWNLAQKSSFWGEIEIMARYLNFDQKSGLKITNLSNFPYHRTRQSTLSKDQITKLVFRGLCRDL